MAMRVAWSLLAWMLGSSVGWAQPPAVTEFSAVHTTATAEKATTEFSERPWLIAPYLMHHQVCDAARQSPEFTHWGDVVRICEGLGDGSALTVSAVLDALEPGGAQGTVQIGYTLSVPLLGLMRQEAETWVLDEAKVLPFLRLMEDIDRPVVIAMSAGHDDAVGPLPEWLRENPDNFMQFPDGSIPALQHWGHPVAPYTLLADESIPVNQWRFLAMQQLASRLDQLPDRVKRRIAGYVLGGHAHHLFPDLDQPENRMAEQVMTDFSPASVAAFRDWLRHKWGAARKFSAATGIKVDDFAEISPPTADLPEKGEKQSEVNVDIHASGVLPVSGWVNDPERRIEQLLLYVNGKPQGEVRRGYARMDVLHSRPEGMSPNVGFRYDLDFSSFAAGKYLMQVVAVAGGLNYELARAHFRVTTRSVSTHKEREPQGARKLQIVEPEGNVFQRWWRLFLRTIGIDRSEPKYASVPGVQSHLDWPLQGMVMQFHPLAREWDEFRQSQVVEYMRMLHTQAVKAGFPQRDLYMGQMGVRFNGNWNGQLYALEEVWRINHPWQNGLMLLGGAASGELAPKWVRRSREPSVVSAWNPLDWKQKEAPLRALRAWREAGVRFIAPFYLSLWPEQWQQVQPQTQLSRLAITPEPANEEGGSLFSAIQEMARQ